MEFRLSERNIIGNNVIRCNTQHFTSIFLKLVSSFISYCNQISNISHTSDMSYNYSDHTLLKILILGCAQCLCQSIQRKAISFSHPALNSFTVCLFRVFLLSSQLLNDMSVLFSSFRTKHPKKVVVVKHCGYEWYCRVSFL